MASQSSQPHCPPSPRIRFPTPHSQTKTALSGQQGQSRHCTKWDRSNGWPIFATGTAVACQKNTATDQVANSCHCNNTTDVVCKSTKYAQTVFVSTEDCVRHRNFKSSFNKYIRLWRRPYIHTCRSYVHATHNFMNGASLARRLAHVLTELLIECRSDISQPRPTG